MGGERVAQNLKLEGLFRIYRSAEFRNRCRCKRDKNIVGGAESW